MANGQFMVVPADGIVSGQAVGRVELYDENGDPWTPGSGEPTTVAWADVTGKPSTFPPSTHTHTIAQVDGLQTILDDYESRIAALETPA